MQAAPGSPQQLPCAFFATQLQCGVRTRCSRAVMPSFMT